MNDNPDSPGGTPQYRRLPWQNGGLLSRGSLWLADDHVLQITSLGICERYQRFYLRDIKAFMTGVSRSHLIGGALCGAFALLFGALLLLLSGGGLRGAVVAGAFCAISLGLALLFLWRGRDTRLYAVTELQTVLWRSVARKWQAGRLLAQLEPLIHAAQSGLARAQPVEAPPATAVAGADETRRAAAAPGQDTPQARQNLEEGGAA